MNHRFYYQIITPLLFQQSVYAESKSMSRKLGVCLSAISALAVLAGGEESLGGGKEIEWGDDPINWENGRTKTSTVALILEQLSRILKAKEKVEKHLVYGKINEYFRMRGEAYLKLSMAL